MRAVNFFNAQPSKKNLFLLFCAAFLLRSTLFFFYIQHEQRYRQADSNDYHSCALLLAYTGTMTRVDNREPIFWRTPGYPLLIAPFYSWHGITGGAFKNYTAAQKVFLWFQILLCSLIPLILFFLARLISGNLRIAWLVAWVSVVHIGFVLAATYLLTDGPASLFFYLFLLFFYTSFSRAKNTFFAIALSALSLSMYTWMRPMGVFVSIITAFLMLFKQTTRLHKLKLSALFLGLFFLTLSPWYIRNYRLTEKIFFCPMSGAYLESFCAPKLVRRVTGWPLEECMRRLFVQVENLAAQQEQQALAQGRNVVVVRHIVCSAIATPWLKAYPWYAAYDWMVQVAKTMFDLYASQLVACAKNTFSYDPLEEFLTEKMAAALYKESIPLWMRLIAWIELVFSLFLWLGILIGLFTCGIRPAYRSLRQKEPIPTIALLWLITALFTGALFFMTGGFGYARLRLPIEPLLLIFSLMFWVPGGQELEIQADFTSKNQRAKGKKMRSTKH